MYSKKCLRHKNAMKRSVIFNNLVWSNFVLIEGFAFCFNVLNVKSRMVYLLRHCCRSKNWISHIFPIAASVDNMNSLELNEKLHVLTAEAVVISESFFPVSVSHITAVLSAAPVRKWWLSPENYVKVNKESDKEVYHKKCWLQITLCDLRGGSWSAGKTVTLINAMN